MFRRPPQGPKVIPGTGTIVQLEAKILDKLGHNYLSQARGQKMVRKRIVTKSLEYAESIINTVREPLIVLDQDLRVVTVTPSGIPGTSMISKVKRKMEISC